MQTFWNKFKKLCDDHNMNPTNAAKAIGVASSSVSGWRHGARPNADALTKLSDYFDVSVEYLVEDDITINIMPKHKTFVDKTLETFESLVSIAPRFISLRHGSPITIELIHAIALYTNCDDLFLLSAQNKEYIPKNKEYDRTQLINHNTYDEIMSLFDKCAEEDNKKTIQLQLSRIVLYWLEKEYCLDEIKQWNGTLVAKLDYIKYHKSHINTANNYGFNYSEIDYFRDKSIEDGKNLDFQYFLTGEKRHIIDTQKEEIDALKNQLAKYEKHLPI